MGDKFDHKARHEKLHRALDELVADFIDHTSRLPSKTNLIELMDWAYLQTVRPTEKEGGETDEKDCVYQRGGCSGQKRLL